jgi:hypothetical protein
VEAESCTVSPTHAGPLLAASGVAGTGLPICTTLEEDRHPAAFETYTVYFVGDAGFTMIERVVSPVDHRYAEYPGPASRVTAPQLGFCDDTIRGAAGAAHTADIGIDHSSVPTTESVALKRTLVPATVMRLENWKVKRSEVV